HFAGPSLKLAFATDGIRRPPVPLTAIFLLARTSDAAEPAHAERRSAVRAFFDLLPHAHNFDETDREAARGLSEDYLTVAGQVPAFSLTYRSDLNSLPDLLSTIEEAVSSIMDPHAEVLRQ